MIKRQGLTAATVAAITMFISGVAHAQFGSANDANSCYSKCGSTAGTGQSCDCDDLCEAYGDCCADKYEWCAPDQVKPVCSLFDLAAPAQNSKVYSRICGTDLGFTFQHGNNIEVLFGDTFQWDANFGSCTDPGTTLGPSGVFNPDDSQAELPVTRPSWVPVPTANASPGGVCSAAWNFDRNETSAPYTFTPMQLQSSSGGAISTGAGDTPLAGFSDGTTAFALWGSGSPLSSRQIFLARRDPNVRTKYIELESLGTGTATNFQNPNAARTTSINDFDPPTGTGSSNVFIWGRPRFQSTDSQTAASNALYLMAVALPFYTPSTGTNKWAPMYFEKINSAGQPVWTSSAASAGPVLSNDFKVPMQMDIKWIAPLKKWIMLYGGDVADFSNPPTVMDQPRHGAIHMRMADFPWGPWSAPTPLLWREEVPWYFQCDANGSTNPQGCDRAVSPPPVYPPGTWEPGTTAFQGGSCRTATENVPTPNLVDINGLVGPCLSPSQRGNLYSPNILPTWTNFVAADEILRVSRTTIYFTVATWYPYDVVLAAADLVLPDRSYTNLRLQVRDYENRMLSATNASQTSTIAGGLSGGAGGATSFFITKATAPQQQGQMSIGDTVLLTSTANGSQFLARSGTTSQLTFVPSASPPPANAVWVIESAASESSGTLVVPGVTPVRLGIQSQNVNLTSNSTGTVSVAAGTGAGTVWTFTFWCEPGDTCDR